MTNFTEKPIKNVLLDINGVLYDSGIEHAIEGSVEALARLETKFKFCLITNECTTPKRLLAAKLNDYGFTSVSPSRIVSPAPVATEYIRQHNLVPKLHVWDEIIEDFEPALEQLRSQGRIEEQPNALVVGDAMSKISRDLMDESLEAMLNCSQDPVLISLGAGRYYKDKNQLRMDTGCYVAAFEFALGVSAVNLGKPSALMFEKALSLIGGNVEDTLMIGDDIVSDVRGAQEMGMRGALVRTGKYKKTDETHPKVKPDAVFDNLSQAVDFLLSS